MTKVRNLDDSFVTISHNFSFVKKAVFRRTIICGLRLGGASLDSYLGALLGSVGRQNHRKASVSLIDKHNRLNVGRIALERLVGALINCSLLQSGGGGGGGEG